MREIDKEWRGRERDAEYRSRKCDRDSGGGSLCVTGFSYDILVICERIKVARKRGELRGIK